MGRILAIDFGTKRTGVAVTDPLRITANGLDTVPTVQLWDFLMDYLQRETVDCIVFGQATQADGQPVKHQPLIVGLMRKIKAQFPTIQLETIDERLTSKRAQQIILQSGLKKKKRQDKSLVDKVSAVLILQDYMESRGL